MRGERERREGRGEISRRNIERASPCETRFFPCASIAVASIVYEISEIMCTHTMYVCDEEHAAYAEPRFEYDNEHSNMIGYYFTSIADDHRSLFT